MNNIKHTPEPWIISDMGFPHQPTVRPVATDMAYIAKVNAGRSEYQENARRIVAAVNACKDIGTEALERGVIAELLAVLQEAHEEIAYWHSDMLTAEERSHPRGSGWARVYDHISAAIAKATGRTI